MHNGDTLLSVPGLQDTVSQLYHLLSLAVTLEGMHTGCFSPAALPEVQSAPWHLAAVFKPAVPITG